jgi:hypothetical protein
MPNPTGRGGFMRGRSGNPGGRPRQLASVMHEARRYTFEAICTLEKLMRTAKSESVRLNAAEAVLSRGWGRPIQALQVEEQIEGHLTCSVNYRRERRPDDQDD